MYENLSEICTSTERVACLVLWFLPLLLFPVSVILRHIQTGTLTQQGKAALASSWSLLTIIVMWGPHLPTLEKQLCRHAT